MKANCKAFVLLGTATLLLTSCFNTSLQFVEYSDYIQEIDTKVPIDKGSYYKPAGFDNLEYLDLDGNTQVIDEYSDIYSSSNSGKRLLMPSTGEQNILVLPVSFKDSYKNDCDSKRVFLQNAFFGDPSKTISESVASYYNKSSFGHLKIKGKVADFYHLPYTSYELTQMGDKTSVSRYVTSLALDYYNSKNNDIFDFDNDKDNYIDGVFLIYDHPYDRAVQSLYWAYVDHMDRNEKINIDDELISFNKSEPYLSTYCWASYDFLEIENNYVDSHIYTHEMGHVLGLNDYYSHNYTAYKPLGYMDMMDYNLGDHNIFSKMLLDWTTPYVVKDDCVIKLRPSYNTGDCVIIPIVEPNTGDLKWNKTPYDEFLVLEFYAHLGVNTHDTHLSFSYKNGAGEDKHGKLFTNFGVKLYHIDSRIAYVKDKNSTSINNIIGIFGEENLNQKLNDYKNSTSNPSWCLDFPFNNKNVSHPYIKLIESQGKSELIKGNAADNSSLFKKGMDFGITCYQDYQFYSGAVNQFNFEILDLNTKEVTIKFTKK